MKLRLGYLAALVALSINAQETKIEQESDVSDIEKITVTGTNQKRYVLDSTKSLTGFPVDFLDLPRVVNIIPEHTGEVEVGNTIHRLALGADYRDSKTTRFFVTTPSTNGVSEAIGGDGALFNISKMLGLVFN